MLSILKELDQIEQQFFIPVNAHPLKKEAAAPDDKSLPASTATMSAFDDPTRFTKQNA